MSSENQTNIRFSLKETVWFQKGQEVKEVRSLSLNPDITIQQFDDYVQVKGVLTLEGNYAPEVGYQGDYYSLRELAPSRMVENVVTLEDGSCELNHQFPVDISIPLTRITDLENLCVTVETFDYQLAEKGSIQIAADLCISGLHDHNRAIETYHEQRMHEQYNNYTYENDYRSSGDGFEHQEEREEVEQFQFFHQSTNEEKNDQDNLYGSDWIQSLEEDDEQEEQETYPQQPTYLEVFQPEEGIEERVEAVDNEAEHYYDFEETNEAELEEDQAQEQSEVYYETQIHAESEEEIEAQSEEQLEEQYDVQIEAQSEVQLEEQSEESSEAQEVYEEVFRGFNISAESIEQHSSNHNDNTPEANFFMDEQSEHEVEQINEYSEQTVSNLNNTPTERPSFLNNDYTQQQSTINDGYTQQQSFLNNDYTQQQSTLNNDYTQQQNTFNEYSSQQQDFNKESNRQQSFLNNNVNTRPSFLNNDYSSLQNYLNNEKNVEKESQNYEEQFNRSVEQSYQPYVNQQYQQAPFSYNQQQPIYQNPYPQVAQPNSYVNPNDVRQTPPYYAEYYQAHVEGEAPPVEQKTEAKAEAKNVVKEEAKQEVSEVRSIKSDNLLSSLFTGEGKEESYSKLKLYLAQNGDTIESVAKKYNLQTQQLNRVNNLNDEFLSEGQIVYIPVTAIKQ